MTEPDRSVADTPASHVARARQLYDRGIYNAAKTAYLAALGHNRYHHDAMLGLAQTYVAAGDLTSAQIVLDEAVVRHPRSAAAYGALGTVLHDRDELSAAREAFLAALARDPVNRRAWYGLAVIFERLSDTAAADHAWREATRDERPAFTPFHGNGEPLRMLLLWSAGVGNVPIVPLLDTKVFSWSTVFVESWVDGRELPPHDVAFNAVGDADLARRALPQAMQLARAIEMPLLNDPARVVATSRDQIARRLGAIPDVMTPRMQRVRRSAIAAWLATDAASWTWPLLVRAPGFHTGKNFESVADPVALETAVAEFPGDEVLLIQYLDTRSADGKYRKYRVMIVDGKLYPLHLAISKAWKVHYFSAEMDAAEHRAEEAAFLDDWERTVGVRAIVALETIRDELGLDYAGIDFALDGLGRVIVFEANATMTVRVPPEGAIWNDARAASERVTAAVHTMLLDRVRRGRYDAGSSVSPDGSTVYCPGATSALGSAQITL